MAEDNSAAKVDIKFVPWPYRCIALRQVTLAVLGLVAVGGGVAAALLATMPDMIAAVLPAVTRNGARVAVDCLREQIFWVWLCVAMLNALWIVAILRFFRHRANAFVRLRVAEKNKIWISYQRGLFGDHSAENRWWGHGWFGFLLEPERGNADNEGRRQPNAITAITNFASELEGVHYFGKRGFRIAYSSALVNDEKSYELPQPKRNEKELSFNREEIELVALNRQGLPAGHYVAAIVASAIALGVAGGVAEEAPIAGFLGIAVAIVPLGGILLWRLVNRIVRGRQYVLYLPKKGELRRRPKGLDATNVVKGLSEQEQDPLRQLLEELWFMSRYTGTGIRAIPAGRSGRQHVRETVTHAMHELSNVWKRNFLRQRSEQDSENPIALGR